MGHRITYTEVVEMADYIHRVKVNGYGYDKHQIIPDWDNIDHGIRTMHEVLTRAFSIDRDDLAYDGYNPSMEQLAEDMNEIRNGGNTRLLDSDTREILRKYPEDKHRTKYINTYEEIQRFGGHEEGGWYYTDYEVIHSQPVKCTCSCSTCENGELGTMSPCDCIGDCYDNKEHRVYEILIGAKFWPTVAGTDNTDMIHECKPNKTYVHEANCPVEIECRKAEPSTANSGHYNPDYIAKANIDKIEDAEPERAHEKVYEGKLAIRIEHEPALPKTTYRPWS